MTRGIDPVFDAVRDFTVGHWVLIAGGAAALGLAAFVVARAGLAKLPSRGP